MLNINISCLNCPGVIARTRGVCPRCYNRFSGQVRLGNTTWDRLEAEGKIAPRKDKVGNSGLFNRRPNERVTCLRCNGFLNCGSNRGICTTCASHYSNEIRHGRTTLAKLEAEGKILPSRSKTNERG